MKFGPAHWIIRLIVVVLFSTRLCAQEQQPSGAVAYLDLIRQGLAQTRSNLPHITASAEQASKNLLAGGNIWAAGRQPGFDGEANGRAGGLMSLRLIGTSTPTTGDVVLYAVPGTLNPQDLQKIKAWQSQGIYVVAFASRTRQDPQPPTPAWLIENLPHSGLVVTVSGQPKLIPADTVLNVINLWLWTGELTAACTRAGKMPIHYMSYGLPGGRKRGQKYKGQTFHDDFQIAPIKAGVLGTRYLDVIDTALESLRTKQIAQIHQAARWFKATPTQNVTVLQISHLFPGHLQDPRAPQRFNRTLYNIGQKGIEPTPHKEMLVIGLSYQQAPKPIIQQAKASGMKFVYNSVQPGDPPEPAENIIYIKPGWPLPDACVKVPGYDVQILPASGVLNALTYWSILADTCKLYSGPLPPAPVLPLADNPKPTNAHEH